MAAKHTTTNKRNTKATKLLQRNRSKLTFLPQTKRINTTMQTEKRKKAAWISGGNPNN